MHWYSACKMLFILCMQNKWTYARSVVHIHILFTHFDRTEMLAFFTPNHMNVYSLKWCAGTCAGVLPILEQLKRFIFAYKVNFK